MPHQCVRCNAFYKDGSKETLEGCSVCKGKFFFYIKGETIPKAQQIIKGLTVEDKQRMEEDVIKIMGDDFEEEKPVVLNVENIKILGPGKFEIDLVDIMKGRPLVYRLEDGKYYIDVPSTFAAKDLGIKEEKSEKNS